MPHRHVSRWHNPLYYVLGGALAEGVILALWWGLYWAAVGTRALWRAGRRSWRRHHALHE